MKPEKMTRKGRGRLGQAMTEYAIMSLAMCAACAFMFEYLMMAYQSYTKAFYLLLILPIP